jgi:tetratricopeptide (TPR) repeat protein
VRVAGEGKHGDEPHAGEGADLAPLRRLIIERTEGTPFFMEEMVQALFEEGVLQRNGTVELAKPISAVKVPATVQSVLASRIDRLPVADKELLQTLAILGREFSLSLAQHVTLNSVDDLEQKLSRLQFGEFIYEQPVVGEVEYSFKHALTQEVAYKSLLSGRRRTLHDRAAHAIEELYALQLNDHYSDLAHHYILSDDAAKAMHYARLAAEQAISRGAYGESISLIESALKLLDKVPEGDERMREELELRSIQSATAHVLYGATSPERERAIRQMCGLGAGIGEADALLRGSLALCQFYFVRGEPVKGIKLAKRSLELAGAAQEAWLLTEAHMRYGLLAYSSGKLREAVSHLEDATLHISRTERKVSPGGFLYSSSIKNVQALALHLLGRVGEASKVAEVGVKDARDSGHLFSLGLWLSVSLGTFRTYRREPELARLHADEAVALSEENGFRDWVNWGRFHHGWALAELGQSELGNAEMEAGLAAFRRAGGAPGQQYAIALLASNYARMGRIEEAIEMLDSALAHIERTGEKVDQAEMLRLKGEVLLTHYPPAGAEVEKYFREALEVARAQEAKWWELRASVSLARLLRYRPSR